MGRIKFGSAQRPLRDTEVAALCDYARTHGRCWKAALRAEWMNASTTGILQELRNAAHFGPTGLHRFRMPKVPR